MPMLQLKRRLLLRRLRACLCVRVRVAVHLCARVHVGVGGVR
jgi:hypothetical protein